MHSNKPTEVDSMNRLRVKAEREVRRLKDALESIQRYGLDTLSGRVDGPDDRAWQRAAVNEMTKRARLALEGKDGVRDRFGDADLAPGKHGGTLAVMPSGVAPSPAEPYAAWNKVRAEVRALAGAKSQLGVLSAVEEFAQAMVTSYARGVALPRPTPESRGQVVNERHTLALKQIRTSLVWAADYCGGFSKLRPEHPLHVSLKAIDELLTQSHGGQHG